MKRRPLLVGIAGGSGSGKTFLARSTAEALGKDAAEVLSMDQYFRSPDAEQNRADINFDHPAHLDFRLLVRHLLTLKSGKSVMAPSYDFRTMFQTPASVKIAPKPIVIVEGLFVLAEPMVRLFDITIFLDVDEDQRLLGRILRDARERNSDIEGIIDRYQRFVRPGYEVFIAPTKQNADVVVDFTYRRILFSKLLTLFLRDSVEEGFDLEALTAEMRAECHHLGFTPGEGTMPVSIDILKLARDYPESASSKPSLE